MRFDPATTDSSTRLEHVRSITSRWFGNSGPNHDNSRTHAIGKSLRRSTSNAGRTCASSCPLPGSRRRLLPWVGRSGQDAVHSVSLLSVVAIAGLIIAGCGDDAAQDGVATFPAQTVTVATDFVPVTEPALRSLIDTYDWHTQTIPELLRPHGLTTEIPILAFESAHLIGAQVVTVATPPPDASNQVVTYRYIGQLAETADTHEARTATAERVADVLTELSRNDPDLSMTWPTGGRGLTRHLTYENEDDPRSSPRWDVSVENISGGFDAGVETPALMIEVTYDLVPTADAVPSPDWVKPFLDNEIAATGLTTRISTTAQGPILFGPAHYARLAEFGLDADWAMVAVIDAQATGEHIADGMRTSGNWIEQSDGDDSHTVFEHRELPVEAHITVILSRPSVHFYRSYS